MSEIDNTEITVVMVSREKFSQTQASVESLLTNTKMPFKFIYMDSKSPASIAKWLREKLEGRPDTTLLRYEYFLGINHSRNIALEQVTTKYVAIVENDVYFHPGWLEELYRCAEEEQADVVSPLINIGGPESTVIHLAGGETYLKDAPTGERYFHHISYFEDEEVADIHSQLKRQPHTGIQLHCFMARTATLKALSKFNNAEVEATGTQELCFSLQRLGAKIFFEPASVVLYLWGKDAPLKLYDLPYWYLMWSEKWNHYQLRVAGNKYKVNKNWGGSRTELWWFGYHRRVPFFPLIEANRKLFKAIKLPFVGFLIEKAFEKVEVAFSYLFVEFLIQTNRSKQLMCPSIFQPYPKPWFKNSEEAETPQVEAKLETSSPTK